MASYADKSILGRNPITSLVLVAMFCVVAGIAMILTAVGAIVGVPLLAIGILMAVVAAVQYRKRCPMGTETIHEVDRRS